MKRTLSLFLAIIMLISWLPQPVFSETNAEFTANGGYLIARRVLWQSTFPCGTTVMITKFSS